MGLGKKRERLICHRWMLRVKVRLCPTSVRDLLAKPQLTAVLIRDPHASVTGGTRLQESIGPQWWKEPDTLSFGITP